MLADISRSNPLRPPHWRWERAGAALRAGVLSRSRDDIWVRRAWGLRRRLQATKREADLVAFAESMPDVYWAHDLFVRKGDTVPTDQRSNLASEIEARILADQPHASIAERIGIDTGTITAYEAIFFNVCDRLKHRSYILHVAIGGRAHYGLQERDLAVIWKLFGYFYGPAMVDALCDTVVNPVRPESGAPLMAAMVDAGHNAITRRAMVAAQTLKLNGFNELDVLKLFQNQQAPGKACGRPVRTAAGPMCYVENVRAMVKSMRPYFPAATTSIRSDRREIKADHTGQRNTIESDGLTSYREGKNCLPEINKVVKFPPLPPRAERALGLGLDGD